MRARTTVAQAGAALLILLMLSHVVSADVQWAGKGDDGNWFDIKNWSPQRLPGDFDQAIIDNGGSAYIAAGNAGGSYMLLDLGHASGSGYISQDGGSLSALQIELGYCIGTSGRYDLYGGSLTVDTLRIGMYGETSGYFGFYGGTLGVSGVAIGPCGVMVSNYGFSAPAQLVSDEPLTTLLVSGGSLYVQGDLRIDQGALAELNNGGYISARRMVVGLDGTGSFVQSGGTTDITYYWGPLGYPLTIGGGVGSSGSYTLSGGSLSANSIAVGDGAGSGVFVQTGGHVGIYGVAIGVTSGSTGRYELSGDGVLEAEFVDIGPDGSGTFVQRGGAVRVTRQILVGGTYELSGGTLTADDVFAIFGNFIWTGGSLNAWMIFVEQGGRLDVGGPTEYAGNLWVGGVIGVQAGKTFTVTGGFGDLDYGLPVAKDGKGALVVAGWQDWLEGCVFNVVEGTVFMNTDAGSASAQYLTLNVGGAGTDAQVVFNADQHLQRLHILSGGRVQTSAGCSVLTTGDVTIDPSAVMIVNGGSMIAAALAGSAGTIRITDPAGGTALTVGSGTSGTFSGTILDDTGPGSLTKVGSGTQTLGGANTYSGGTKVLEGTLLVENTAGSGTGTGPVTVGAATLGGTGFINGPVTLTGDSTLTSTGTLTINNTLTVKGLANQLAAGTVLTSGDVTIEPDAVFIINGTLGGGTGSLIVRGTLMGKGTINKDCVLEAGGVLSPGSPSTIQGMAQMVVGGGPQTLAFEIGAAGPNYASPANSVNDLVRLTDGAAPFADATGGAAALAADTVIDVYFLSADPALGEYKAEFFAATDFSDAVAGATYEYWRLDPRGTRYHNGNFYSPLDASLVDWSVVPETAAFDGTLTSGYITEFTVMPEPATLALVVAGAAAAMLRRKR